MKRSEFRNRLFNSGGNAGISAKKKEISLFVGTVVLAIITITACVETASDVSATAKDATVPGAPTAIQATVAAASVTVTWTAPTDTGQDADANPAVLSGFTVYYSTVSSFTPASAEGRKEVTDNTATNVVVDGLTGDTLYYFIVTASNATGESAASESVSVALNYSPADSVPAAPTLAETSVGENSVTLTWALSSPGYIGGDGTEATITSYTLFYDEASKYAFPAAAAADFAALYPNAKKIVIDMSYGASNVYTVDNLKAATLYYFLLRTENRNGYSALSAVIGITTAAEGSGIKPDAAPGQVSNVNTVKGDGEVFVSWDAPDDNGLITVGELQEVGKVTQYTVYYTTDGTNKVNYLAGPKVKSMVFTTPDNDGNPVSSGTISGLENFKTYYFAVTASNAFAEGPGYPDVADVSAIPSPADVGPGAPTDVTVTAGDSKVLVRWKAPANPGIYNGEIGSITGYKVYYSDTTTELDDLTTTTLTPTEVGNVVSVEIANLTNDTEYFFVVVAVNGAGDGSASSKASAAPTATAKYGTVPGAPTVGQATGAAASVTVTWTAPADTGQDADANPAVLSGFTVYYSTVSSFTPASAEGQKKVADNTATNVVVDGLTGDTIYYFIVTASNATGESAASGSASAVANYSDAESVSKEAVALTSILNILHSVEMKFIQDLARTIFQTYTVEYDTIITWTSSGDAVAIDSETGVWTVTRPGADAADASITLTATITKGEAKETVITTVTVPKVATKSLADLTAEEFDIELRIANPVEDGGTDKIAVGVYEGADQVATALSFGSLGLKASTGRNPFREFVWAIVAIDGGIETTAIDKFQIDDDGKISISPGKITTADTAFKLRAVSMGLTYVAGTYKEVDLLLKVDAIALTPDLLAIAVGNKTVVAGTGGSHLAYITSSLTAGIDYDLSIDKAGTAVDAVSIYNSGSIDIADTIVLADAGTYTVTATGIGNYEGTVTASFDLTVQNKNTVSYNVNGGEGTPNPETQTVNHGDTIASAPTAISRTGYTLSGWNTQADGTGDSFTFGTTAVTDDITLFAQWTLVLTREILVESGTFQMGSADSEAVQDENPVHSVTVNSFYMAETEVTFDQYDAYCAAMGISKPSDSDFGRGSRPVINVSWYDALKYSNWLSEQKGLSPAYEINGTSVIWNQSASGYRLPTEAEWEYAARGGNQSQGYKYAGSNDVNEVSWYWTNSGNKTQLVKGKKANELGLYDMSGNAREWCWDWYDSAYYSSSPEANPTGPSSGSQRVIRGGGSLYLAKFLRSADREHYRPDNNLGTNGFRLTRSAD